jgi:hypothetical protein
LAGGVDVVGAAFGCGHLGGWGDDLSRFIVREGVFVVFIKKSGCGGSIQMLRM